MKNRFVTNIRHSVTLFKKIRHRKKVEKSLMPYSFFDCIFTICDTFTHFTLKSIIDKKNTLFKNFLNICENVQKRNKTINLVRRGRWIL